MYCTHLCFQVTGVLIVGYSLLHTVMHLCNFSKFYFVFCLLLLVFVSWLPIYILLLISCICIVFSIYYLSLIFCSHLFINCSLIVYASDLYRLSNVFKSQIMAKYLTDMCYTFYQLTYE